VPVIQVDPFHNPTTEMANIVIPTKVSGVELEGTAYRMDSVSLRMRKLVDVDFPSDEEVLDKIIAKIREIKGASS
jgi:formylmethanofuran dehydrogenase subunit B